MEPECGNLLDHIGMLPMQASELNVRFKYVFFLLFFSFSVLGLRVLLHTKIFKLVCTLNNATAFCFACQIRTPSTFSPPWVVSV